MPEPARSSMFDNRNYCLDAQGPVGSRRNRGLRVAVIYKICERAAWQSATREGTYRGSPVDARDGFIHFSSAAQLAETAAQHFAGQADLMLVAVDADALGPALKWEVSRGGALFPHLHAELAM